MYEGKPVVLCEYAHSMENSLGNFKEYMDDFEKYDNMCGGFIWDFVDQTIHRVNENGQDEWLYGDDIIKSKCSFLHLSKVITVTCLIAETPHKYARVISV